MSESNDPLNPVYQQGSTSMQEEEPRSGIGSKTNILVMVALALVGLALIFFLGKEEPAQEPVAPAATEVH